MSLYCDYLLAIGNNIPHITGDNKRNWEPNFVEQVPNITIAAGKDATLSCQVDNLQGYKVGNVNSSWSILFQIHYISKCYVLVICNKTLFNL